MQNAKGRHIEAGVKRKLATAVGHGNRCNKAVFVSFLKDSTITCDQYRALGFPGAVELGNMFEFYVRGKPDRDTKATRKLNPETQRFDVWVRENKAMLEQAYSSVEAQSS